MADEKILVVKRELLFQGDDFQGFKAISQFADIEKRINEHKEFLWRSEMEENTAYKQIIPYMLFKHHDSYFVMKRRDNASEKRLASKYSLGIGGHVREEDLQAAGLPGWAMREFHEEVEYEGTLRVIPLGMINDDSNDVGKVHIGFVFLLLGSNDHISIKDEHKEGYMRTLSELEIMYESMESWSQIVIRYLQNISIQQQEQEVSL